MATEAPNSYRDPYWADLATKAAKKYDVPAPLLVAVLTKGERSNSDQVSEKGARTPFQVTPETRAAVLKRDGIDAYLSPENAAEAAAIVLKDGMNWAKGRSETPEQQQALASGFYHAGGDTSAWGPRTRSYIQRVTGGTVEQPRQQSPIAQERATIARAYDAYRAGRMSPEDAAEFEKDVNAGTVNLPLGASLIRRAEASYTVPQSVVDAYKSGKMSPEDRAEFERDMRANPQLAPAGLELPAFKPSIPGAETYDARPTPAAPTLGQEVVGAGEGLLSAGTGLIGGSVGALGGVVSGLTDPQVTNLQQLGQAAERGASALTYQPRTEVGQERAQQLGELGQNALPVAMLAPQMAALSRAGQVAKPTVQAIPQVARNTAAAAAENVATAARAVPDRVGQMMGREPAAPTPGTMASGGSAAVDMATQRRMAAQELPVPIELTKGQATRDYTQQRFEGETAKNPEIGEPIRQRFNEQNQQVIQNFESFIDSTGAQAPDSGRGRFVGMKVDKSLNDQLARDKTEVKVKYATARKSDEAKAQVDQSMPVSTGSGDDALTTTPLQFINDQPTGVPASALSDAAKQYAVKIGVAEMDEAGNLVAKPGATVSQMEDWRAAINGAVGNDPAQIRQATILKKLIDGQTEPLAGPLYRDARNARARLAQNYEDRATINRLMTNKPGTSDRRVAFEDVFKSAILDGSLDDVRNVRRVLHRGGEDGMQAWKELQGQTVAHLRDEAFGNMARDSTGNVIVSEAKLKNAVKHLDDDGKLDFIFGKRGAEQIRTLTDVVSDLKNVSPGAVNNSNTASVLAGLIDVGLTAGSGGIPMPVASTLRVVVNNVKDRRLRMRVAQALGDAERKAANKPKPVEGVTPKKRTLH